MEVKRSELSEEELNKITGGEMPDQGVEVLKEFLKKSVQPQGKLASEADIDSAEPLTPKEMFI